MSILRKIAYATAIGTAFYLTGCSSGSSSSSTVSPSAVQITGLVSAPGATTGAIAFAQPDISLKSLFASLFTSQAQAAAISGTAPVGAGVTVDLIEIDNSGNKVGSTIATSTTVSDGSYTISAPSTFAVASKYVVRATSATDATKYLDSIVTSTSVDVDPATDVTKSLVIAAASGVGLSTVTPEAIAEIQNTVAQLANEAPAFADLATAKSTLLTQNAADEEACNVVSSIASSGVISGSVTDSTGMPLPNIKIIARDFGNWVTRAVTRTNASGAYTFHVPAGNYILGAINMTTTSTAASEWWTAAGGANNQFSADKITVVTTVSKDFVLDPGVRISGTVTGETTTLPIRGIQIELRDFVNDQPVNRIHSAKDGTYIMNVRPGSYTIGAYNMTLQPYATELYNVALNGGMNATQAEKITLALGAPKTADFSLQTGYAVSGAITDGASGPVVAGMAVRFYTSTGAFVKGLRTNNQGQYRLWLRSNSVGQAYQVRARGQTLSEDLSAPSSQTAQNFAAPVGQITAILNDVNGNPLSQTKVSVYDTTAAYAYQGFETSNGDGTVTVYSTVTPVKVEFKVDNGIAIASQLYNSVTQMSSATSVAVNVGGSTTALSTVSLPAGVELSGVINVAGIATGDRVVQIRSGGTAAGNQFVSTRSQLDGSYSISLPAGTYSVRACNPGAASCSAFTTVTIGSVSVTQNLTSPS